MLAIRSPKFPKGLRHGFPGTLIRRPQFPAQALWPILCALRSMACSTQSCISCQGRDAYFNHIFKCMSLTHILCRACLYSSCLSPATPASVVQVGMRCWNIKFDSRDHAFLHRSHVFSSMSSILATLNESMRSFASESLSLRCQIYSTYIYTVPRLVISFGMQRCCVSSFAHLS